jgi:hypothetical protein
MEVMMSDDTTGTTETEREQTAAETEVDLGNFLKRFSESMQHVRFGDEIPFPVEVSLVKYGRAMSSLHDETPGTWVSVRPCTGDGTRTYLGVLLGDLQVGVSVSYHMQTKELTILPRQNPAIWVPDLNKIVWGAESWWGRITSPEGLRDITDADIQNVWYVKALKDLTAAQTETDSNA